MLVGAMYSPSGEADGRHVGTLGNRCRQPERGAARHAAPRLCLRSTRKPVAMSPQIWMPPLMRRPVQMMISVRAGRICWTAFSVATVRFALRPFRFAGSSPGVRGISPSAIAWKRSTT